MGTSNKTTKVRCKWLCLLIVAPLVLLVFLFSLRDQWMLESMPERRPPSAVDSTPRREKRYRPVLFVGVLSGPAEKDRRMDFRNRCVPKWKHAIDAGLLVWRFFLGEPESKTEVNRFFSHTQGAKASQQVHDEAIGILDEIAKFKDIEVGAYGDHYVTVTRKVNEIFRIGSSPEEGWDPDYIVKLDSDHCLQYDEFVNGLHEYMQIYRDRDADASFWDAKTRGNLTNLEMIYRPPLGGSSTKNSNDQVVDTKYLPQSAPPLFSFLKKSLNSESDKPGVYVSQTNFSRPIFPVFSSRWFLKADDNVQLGYDNTFEPYPSGSCYVLPTELVRIMMSPRDRVHTVLTLEALGTTSEDVNVGYLLSRTTDAHRFLLDLVRINHLAASL